jgi:quercetin dioxygenase-like cupin family protein
MNTKRTKKAASPVLDADIAAKFCAAIAPAELSAVDRERMRARIMAGIAADPPQGTFTVRASGGQWLSIAPGIEIKILRIDRQLNNQTALFRLQPGAQIVSHRHTQEEECMVLEGEVFLGDYRLGAGDMHVALPGAVHPPIRAPRGAVLCIRSEIPPQSFQIA